MICRVLGVWPSGCYAGRRRSESRRAAENRALLVEIQAVHAHSGGAYGAPRVHAHPRTHGRRVGRRRIARRMRLAGLRGLAAIARPSRRL